MKRERTEAFHGCAGLVGICDVLQGEYMKTEPPAGNDINITILGEAYQCVFERSPGNPDLCRHFRLGIEFSVFQFTLCDLVLQKLICLFLKRLVLCHKNSNLMQ